MADITYNMTVAEILGPWVEPDWDSGLIARCREAWNKPRLIEQVVAAIWLAADQPCGKRLVPIQRQWLPYYERRHGGLSGRQRKLVREISAATLDRLLAPARAQHWRGRGGTKPGSLLRSEIPIRTGTRDLSLPGYLEADSVAHCGTSLAGSFIWSLTYTDILSGWTEGGRRME